MLGIVHFHIKEDGGTRVATTLISMVHTHLVEVVLYFIGLRVGIEVLQISVVWR